MFGDSFKIIIDKTDIDDTLTDLHEIVSIKETLEQSGNSWAQFMDKSSTGFDASTFGHLSDVAVMANEAISTLETLQTMATNNGGVLNQVYTSLFSGLKRNVDQMKTYMHSVDAWYTKYDNSMTRRAQRYDLDGHLEDLDVKPFRLSQSRMEDRVLDLASMRRYTMDMNAIARNQAQYGTLSNQHYSAIAMKAEDEARKLLARAGHLPVSAVASQLASSATGSAIRRLNTSQTLSDQELEKQIESVLIGRMIDTDNFSVNALQYRGRQNPQHIYSIDDIPEKYRQAFYSRGEAALVAPNARQVNAGTYKQIRKYINNANNPFLLQLAREAGIYDEQTGNFSANPTYTNMSLLGGYLARFAADTKAGAPQWARDPNTAMSQGKVLRSVTGLMDIMAKDQNIVPGYNQAIIQAAWQNRSNNRFSIPANVQHMAPYPAQYVIPKTYFNDQGQLVFQDPNTAHFDFSKRKHGAKEERDDPFVMFSNSQMSHLLGYNPLWDNYTYGYGRDKNSQSVYGTPKIIRVRSDNMFAQDGGYNSDLDAKKAQYLADAINNGTTYDNTRYEFAYANGEDTFFIPADEKKKIREGFKKALLLDPFEGFNIGGLIQHGDKEKTAKLINSTKRWGSPAIAMSAYGKTTPNIAPIDFGALYNLFNMFNDPTSPYYAPGKYSYDGITQILKENKLDSAVMAMPGFMNGSAQFRAAGPAIKGTWFTNDYKSIISRSGYLNNAFNNPNNLVVVPNANSVGGKSFYLPTPALTEMGDHAVKWNGTDLHGMDILRKFWTNDFSAAERQGGLPDWIRDTFFIDVLDKNIDAVMPDSALKNVGKFAKMYSWQLSAADLDQAKREGRYDPKDDTVIANVQQYRKHLTDTINATGGIFTMKMAEDFASSQDQIPLLGKTYHLPESILQTMTSKLPMSLFERSAQLYQEAFAKLNNPAELFAHDPEALEQMKNNPDWLANEGAKRIEESRQALQNLQNRRHVLLDQPFHDALALPMPGSPWQPILEGLLGGQVDTNSLYKYVFPSVLRAEGIIGKDAVPVFSAAYNHADVVGMRNPDAVDANVVMRNLGQIPAMQSLFKIIQADMDATYLPPEALYRMNTGDFDGDTIRMYFEFVSNLFDNLKDIHQNMETAKNMHGPEKEFPKVPNLATNIFGTDAVEDDLGQSRVSALAGHKTGLNAMGAAMAALKNAVALPDSDSTKWSGIYEAAKYYDLATSEIQNQGLDINMKKDFPAAHQLMMRGRNFGRFLSMVSDWSTDSDTPTANSSIFKYRTADRMNPMEMGLLAVNSISRKNGIFNNDMRPQMQSWIASRYGSTIPAFREAAEWYGKVIADQYSGRRFYSKDELSKASAKHVTNMHDALNLMTGVNKDPFREEITAFQKSIQHLTSDEHGLNIDSMQKAIADPNTPKEMADLYTMLIQNQLSAEEMAVEEAYYDYNDQREKDLRQQLLSYTQANPTKRMPSNTTMNKVFAGSNVTSVEPWIRPFSNVQGTTTKLAMQNGQLVTTANQDFFDMNFNRYNRKGTIEASEILRAEGNDNYIDNAAIQLGNLMHNTFEEGYRALAEGKQYDFNAIFGDKLQNEFVSIFSKFMPDFDQYIKQDSAGRYGLDPGGPYDAKFASKFNAISGYNTVNGMSVFDLVDAYRKMNGYDIAGIEGEMYLPGNLVDGNKSFVHLLSHGNNVPVFYDYTGKPIQLTKEQMDVLQQTDAQVRAKPDLELSRPDPAHPGQLEYAIFDWKSSDNGAKESLVQSDVYKRIRDSLGIHYYEGLNNGLSQQELALYEPFSRYIEPLQTPGPNGEKYRSRITSLNGVDPLLSQIETLAGNDLEAVNDLFLDSYIQAVTEKNQDLQNGYVLGWAELNSAKRALFGGDKTNQYRTNTRMANASNDQNANSAANVARQYYVDQYSRDVESFGEVQGNVFKESRKLNPLASAFGVYNRFAHDQNILNDLFSNATIVAMRKQFENDPLMQEEINKQIASVEQAKSMMTENIIQAAVKDPIDAIARINNEAFGVKGNPFLERANAIENIVRRAEGTKEALKNDPTLFDAKTQTWLHDPRADVFTDANGNIDRIAEAAEIERAKKATDAENVYNNAAPKAIAKLQEARDRLYDNILQQATVSMSAEVDTLTNTEMTTDEKIELNVDKDKQTLLSKMAEYESSLQTVRTKLAEQLSQKQRDFYSSLEVLLSQQLGRIQDFVGVDANGNPTFNGVGFLGQASKTADETRLKESIVENQKRETEQNLISQITGRANKPAMREIRAQALANNLQGLINKNYKSKSGAFIESKLPAELRPYVDQNGDVSVASILTMLNNTNQENTDAQVRMLQSHSNINHNNRMAQMNLIQRQLDMTRTQYGPTFTGRAWQYNDQQYSHWAQRYQAAQGQIDATNATIAELNNQRSKTTDPGDLQVIDAKLQDANSSLTDYTNQLYQAEAAMKEFSSLAGGMRTGLISVANAAESLILQLGKRALQAAFKEASTFIRQFDADMIQIQAITQKSNTEMQDVRSSSISQAQKLKTSVKNVTATKSALYRQGLSDAEVEERTDAIVKFSTVTGAKVTDATKGLTTAIQTGLVSSITEAMDVLAALGDSAATTAEEIEKGMQKAAASAKVAGVSYEELTSMLTIATSKTQLGGAQAGTFFQTLFSRMNRVTKQGFITDESGETTNINDVEAALKTAGITLRESKTTFRNSFDVLRDVAQVWEGLSDLQKGNITYAMAGGRQANMFNTLMAGMGEDGGKLLDEYLGLAENSEGTVQSKYEITIQSIQAALDNLKSTFDGFVETLGSNNIITSFMDGITGMIQGFTNLNNAGAGLITVIGLIGAAIAALTVKIAVFSMVKDTALGDVGGLLSTVGALAAGGVVAALFGGAGNLFAGKTEQPSQQEISKENVSNLQTTYNNRNQLVQDSMADITSITEKYKDTFDSKPEEATMKLSAAVQNLTSVFPGLKGVVDELNPTLEQYTTLVQKAAEASEVDKQKQAQRFLETALPGVMEAVEEYQDVEKEFIKSHTGYDFNGAGRISFETTEAHGALAKYLGGSNEINDAVLDKMTSSESGVGLAHIVLAALGHSNIQLTNAQGEDIERPEDLIQAIDYYLKMNDVTLKSGDSTFADLQISSWKQLQELSDDSLFIETYFEGLTQMMNNFLLYMNDENILTNMLSNAATLGGTQYQQLQTLFKDNLRPVFTSLGITAESVIEGFVKNYFDQYKDTDKVVDVPQIVDYMQQVIGGQINVEDIFMPTDKNAFKYSLGGIFGFNDIDEASVTKAFNRAWDASPENQQKLIQYLTGTGPNIQKILGDAMNNATNAPLLSPITELAQSVSITSKSKGYVDEYRQLLTMLTGSSSFEEFDVKSRMTPNLEKVLSNDPELVKMINELSSGNATSYTQEYLAEYLLSKVLGGTSFSDYMATVVSTATSLADQRSIVKAGTSGLTPEMKQTIADTFKTSFEDVDANIELYYQAYTDRYKQGVSDLEIKAQEDIGSLLEVYYKQHPDTKNLRFDQLFKEDKTGTAHIQEAMDMYASAAGMTFDLSRDEKTGQVIVTANVGSMPKTKTNPFLSRQSVFTQRQQASVASALLNSPDWQLLSKGYNSDLLNTVYKNYPELAEYLALKDQGKGNTEQAQALRRDIEIKINVDQSGYADLVKLGQLTQDVADSLTQIKSMQEGAGKQGALTSMFEGIFARSAALNAYARIISGDATPSDYQALSAVFGGDASQYSVEEIQTQYGAAVSAETTAVQQDAEKTASEYGAAFGAAAAKEAGWSVDRSGNVSFSATKSRMQSYNEGIQADKNIADYSAIALRAYNALTMSQMNPDEFSKAMQGMSEYSAFASEMMSNPAYAEAINNNWKYTYRDMLLSSGLGHDVGNALMNEYDNQDVLTFYNALMNKDKGVLGNLARTDPKIVEALNSWIGGNLNDLVDKIFNDVITDAELNTAKQTLAQQKLTAQYESNMDMYDKEAMTGASALYGSEQERNAYLRTLTDRVAQTRIDELLLQNMRGAENANDLSIMQDIAKRMGWSETAVSRMTGSDIEVEDLFSDVRDQSADLSNSFQAIEEACYDYAAAIQGIAGGLSEDGMWNWNDIAAWSGAASGRSSAAVRLSRINDLLSLATNSEDGAAFLDSLYSSGNGFAWTQNRHDVNAMVTDSALAPLFYSLFKHKDDGSLDLDENEGLQLIEGSDWNLFLEQLRNVSAYSGLGYDATYAARMGQLDTFAGGGAGSFIGQLMSGEMDRESFVNLLAQDNGIKEWIDSIAGGKDALENFLTAEKNVDEYGKRLGRTLNNAGSDFRKYGDNAENVQKALKGLAGSQQEYNATVTQMNKDMTKANNNQWLRNQWRKGDRSSKVIEAVMEQTGMSKKAIMDAANKSIVDGLLDSAQEVDLSSLESYAQTLTEQISSELSKVELGDIPVDSPLRVILNGGSVQDVGIGELAGQLQGIVSADVATLIQLMSAYMEASWDISQSADGKIKAVLKPNSVNFKGGGGGGIKPDSKGGGGGGGKSAADKLLQNLKNKVTIRDHRIKMTQLQEEKYHQLGMLGNENNMIEYENTLQQEKAGTLAENITKLRSQLKVTERGSDDWQKLYEQVLKYEEELDQTNNTITANTIKMLENSSAIRKSRTDLEELVVQEIEARIQKQREMLAASVEMQDMVVDAIKQRYQDEWDLITKDLEKKREALEEEKSLIDKRLQARKDAQDEAEKYEELAEYRRQLALISMDSTRTKDAAALREKIADLENDLAWKTAEDEAEAQKESLDSQLQGLDKYQQYGDEDLQLLLEDANNFSSEVSEVMQMNQADMFDWLKNNVKDYANSLKDAQTQMVQSWEDTYKQMLGITDTYWDQVDEILSSKNNFAEFMMASDTFKNASETQKQELLYQWLDAITSGSYIYYMHAQQNWATYSHDDDEFADYNGGSSGGSGSKGGNTGGPTNNGNTGSGKYGVFDDKGRLVKAFDSKSRAQEYLNMIAYNDGYSVRELTTKEAVQTVASSAQKVVNSKPVQTVANAVTGGASAIVNATTEAIKNVVGSIGKLFGFSEGGDVPFTGLAMVHGSPAKPEAFLDNEDRNTMRGILDSGFMSDMQDMVASFKSLNTSRYIPHIWGDDMYTSDAKVTVGDINISTEAINDEADFELLAKKIGQEFIKDLSMQGIGTNKFSF